MELVKVTHNSHDGSISEEKMDSKPFITKKNVIFLIILFIYYKYFINNK